MFVYAYAGSSAEVISRVNAVYTATPVLYTSDDRPVPSLFTTWRTLLILGRPGGFYRPHRRVCLSSSLVALLLLLSGIESNPGPEVRMGSLNARSVVRKGPLIQELITSHRLDALAICETWICKDDPDAINLDSVPYGFPRDARSTPDSHTSKSRRGTVLHTSQQTDGETTSGSALDLDADVRTSNVSRCRFRVLPRTVLQISHW